MYVRSMGLTAEDAAGAGMGTLTSIAILLGAAYFLAPEMLGIKKRKPAGGYPKRTTAKRRHLPG